MTIKKKISLGFVVIGSILLVSSAISIYEFVRMRSTVSNLINDNISAINTTRILTEVTDEYSFNLLESLGDEHGIVKVRDKDDNRFGKKEGMYPISMSHLTISSSVRWSDRSNWEVEVS